MDTHSLPVRDATEARRLAARLPLYAATIFFSAFLLFGIQPMFAKMVLPRLGGSPAVWSVAMVFFQALLELGAVVTATAHAAGLSTWIRQPHQTAALTTDMKVSPQVAIVAKRAQDVGLSAEQGWVQQTGAGTAWAWRDDYADVVSAIWRKVARSPGAGAARASCVFSEPRRHPGLDPGSIAGLRSLTMDSGSALLRGLSGMTPWFRKKSALSSALQC